MSNSHNHTACQNDTPLLEPQNGHLVGKHPDSINISDFEAAGHTNTR